MLPEPSAEQASAVLIAVLNLGSAVRAYDSDMADRVLQQLGVFQPSPNVPADTRPGMQVILAIDASFNP